MILHASHTSDVANFYFITDLFQVGDRVELAEDFEKYGDAVGGPLRVGDRGVVVELQRGPNKEM
jgi:hypothetical protein